MTKVKEWANTCRSKHETCQGHRNRPRQKPTRLLDVCSESVKLITVDKNKSYLYVTVSHRWDNEVSMLTRNREKATWDRRWVHVETLGTGKPVNSFSKMFEKAFEIVRVCGLRYVWIDSLCIIQDTVKKEGKDFNEDWERNATKMGDIYAGGELYVFQAVTDSTDWHNGVGYERKLETILNTTDFVSIATLPSRLGAARPYVFHRGQALLCSRYSGIHRRNHQAMTQWTRMSRSC